MTKKKSTSLMKTVLTNVAQDLEKYEERDFMYEFWMTLVHGKVPTSYRVVNTLAVASRFLRDVTKDRKSKGES
jgi:hypothetical protein